MGSGRGRVSVTPDLQNLVADLAWGPWGVEPLCPVPDLGLVRGQLTVRE